MLIKLAKFFEAINPKYWFDRYENFKREERQAQFELVKLSLNAVEQLVKFNSEKTVEILAQSTEQFKEVVKIAEQGSQAASKQSEILTTWLKSFQVNRPTQSRTLTDSDELALQQRKLNSTGLNFTSVPNTTMPDQYKWLEQAMDDVFTK